MPNILIMSLKKQNHEAEQWKEESMNFAKAYTSLTEPSGIVSSARGTLRTAIAGSDPVGHFTFLRPDSAQNVLVFNPNYFHTTQAVFHGDIDVVVFTYDASQRSNITSEILEELNDWIGEYERYGKEGVKFAVIGTLGENAIENAELRAAIKSKIDEKSKASTTSSSSTTSSYSGISEPARLKADGKTFTPEAAALVDGVIKAAVSGKSVTGPESKTQKERPWIETWSHRLFPVSSAQGSRKQANTTTTPTPSNPVDSTGRKKP